MSSTSAPVSITIGSAGASVATMNFNSSPGSPTTGGTPITFNVTLMGAAGAPANPTGTVTFKNGAQVMSAGRRLTNGSVNLPWPLGLPVGTDAISAAYSGDTNYAPVTQTLTIVVNPSPNDKFVMHLYADMIGQQDAGGEAYWVSQLNKGVPRAAVAYAFTQTPQYAGGVVSRLYTNVMARPVDANGSSFWIDQLLHKGLPPEGLAASLVASDERYLSPSFGNNDPDTFIHATYKAMLGRDAEPAGAAFWHDFLMSGGPRWKLSLDFAYSQEWATQTVTRDYAQLKMSLDGGALSFWVGQVLGGMSDSTLMSQLAGSQSYFDAAQH
jgi:hypothetical protein